MPPTQEPASGDSPPAWQRVFLIVFGSALMFHFWGAQPFGTLHDDTCYISTALGWLGELDAPPRGRALGASIMMVPYLVVSPDWMGAARVTPTLLSLLFLLLFHSFVARFAGAKLALPLSLAVLVSPGFLLSACNVMGEPILNLAIWCAVISWGRLSSRPAQVLLVGALIAAALSRSEGVVLTAAALLTLALPRVRRHPKTLAWLAGTGLLGLLWAASNEGIRVQLLGIARGISGTGSPFDYFASWADSFLRIIGERFLLSPGPGFWGGLLFCCLALVGWARLPNHGASLFLKIFVPLMGAALFLWPYPDTRYFLSLWPILVLLSARALPAKVQVAWAWGLVAVVTVVALPNLQRALPQQELRAAAKAKTFEWLSTQTDPSARLVSEFSCRYLLMTRRKNLKFSDLHGFPQLAQYAADHPHCFVVVENNPLLKNVQGNQYFTGLPRLYPWLEASPLATKVFSNGQDVIFQLKATPGLADSLREYWAVREQDLSQPEQLELAIVSLEKARQRTPGLPFLESHLAVLLLSQGRADEGVTLLEGVLRQYPFDLSSIYSLALADLSSGREDRGLKLIEEGIRTGKQFGERELTAKLEALRRDYLSRPK